jgi:hypothetical protein
VLCNAARPTARSIAQHHRSIAAYLRVCSRPQA